jgi:glycosyltransferase involved in cell wall biosynthesis
VCLSILNTRENQLRILHYAPNIMTLAGGRENFVLGLVNHLRKFGIEQSIVTNSSSDKSSQVPFDDLTVFSLTERKFGAYIMLENLVQVLRRKEFDLINIHGYGEYTADMTCLLKKTGLLRIPIVLTTHGLSGLVNAYSAISPASLLTPSQRIKRFPHLFYDFTLGRLEVTTFDRIIVLSEEERTYLSRLGLKEEKVVKIPVAANDIFFSTFCNTGKRENHIIYVGRIVEYKGLDTLVKAMKELRVVSNIELKCIIIGKDFGYRSELQSLVDKLGITDLVEFIDHTPQNRLVHYYSSALVTVLCSLTEGFPLSLVESMAAGTPFVATPVGAIPDLVNQTKAGLIVPISDPKALADAIRQLVGNRKMWAEMSTSGRENAIKFRWDSIAKSYYQLYKDLVHNQRTDGN